MQMRYRVNTPGEYDGRVGGKGITLSNISPLVDDVAIGFQSPESLMVLSGYEILSSSILSPNL